MLPDLLEKLVRDAQLTARNITGKIQKAQQVANAIGTSTPPTQE